MGDLRDGDHVADGHRNVMSQLSLFDAPEEPKSEKPEAGEELRKWAFLYTSTEHVGGNNKSTIIRFMMTVEDAMKWCESDLSKGVMYGGKWAYFWTSVYNFTFCRWGDSKVVLDAHADNGTFDERIKSLGLRKYSIAEIPGILRPLGVECEIKGSKERLIDSGLITEEEWEETEKRLNQVVTGSKKGRRAE